MTNSNAFSAAEVEWNLRLSRWGSNLYADLMDFGNAKPGRPGDAEKEGRGARLTVVKWMSKMRAEVYFEYEGEGGEWGRFKTQLAILH